MFGTSYTCRNLSSLSSQSDLVLHSGALSPLSPSRDREPVPSRAGRHGRGVSEEECLFGVLSSSEWAAGRVGWLWGADGLSALTQFCSLVHAIILTLADEPGPGPWRLGPLGGKTFTGH
jgi:hypothetical protein